MRHRIVGRTLGRKAPHRLAMFRNMTRSLIEHERIITTIPKAKELRPFIEHIITLVRRGLASGDSSKELHARRLVIARLGPVAKAEFVDEDGFPIGDNLLRKLFQVIGPRYANRPGGYTRIIKRSERRLGDAGETAIIELLKDGEIKVRASIKERRVAPAPAPMLEAPVVQTAALEDQTPATEPAVAEAPKDETTDKPTA